MTVLDPSPFRLTDLTDCGGCAAKLGADLLAEALAGLGAETAAGAPDALLAGLTPPDDAAVYRVSDDLAIIGTLDFFPPLVDDPRTFGEIAAANALSDVFAMGGRVLFALSIAAFPEDLPRDVMTEIFAGASAKVREAGGTLAGGHTIRDPEPKYGLAVIGAAHPDHLLRKGGARPGDRLLLTKPLGTGVLVSGARQGRTSPADLATAIDGMRRLNRAASDALVAAGVRSATDVTGFGLLGHGLEMARASGTRFVFDAASLPALPGALDLAAAGVETGGAAHNRRYVAGVAGDRPRGQARAGHPGPRPTDLGRSPGRRRPGPRRRPHVSLRRRRCRALVDRPRRGRRARRQPHLIALGESRAAEPSACAARVAATARQCSTRTFRPTTAMPRPQSTRATPSASARLPWAARPAARPHRNSWTRLATRAAPIATSTSSPKERQSEQDAPGTMTEASIDDSHGRSRRVERPTGPWTRWATISDQACASQKAATAMSSDSPISSGHRVAPPLDRRGS